MPWLLNADPGPADASLSRFCRDLRPDPGTGKGSCVDRSTRFFAGAQPSDEAIAACAAAIRAIGTRNGEHDT